MTKIVSYDFRSFMNGEHKKIKPYDFSMEDFGDLNGYKLISIGSGMFAILAPKTVFATTAGATFGEIMDTVLSIVDWIIVGVIIFSGLTWMFGKQTKGIELLICGCSGYLLARHAVDIRDFLKAI